MTSVLANDGNTADWVGQRTANKLRGAMPALPGGGAVRQPAPGGLTGNCPDMAKVEAIESFDFEKESKIKADVAQRSRRAAAAAEMKALSDKIDADPRWRGGNLAR